MLETLLLMTPVLLASIGPFLPLILLAVVLFTLALGLAAWSRRR